MNDFNVRSIPLLALLSGFVLLFSAKSLSAVSIKNSHLDDNSQLTRHIELSEGVTQSELIELLQKEFQLTSDFGLIDKSHLYVDQLGYEHQRVLQTLEDIPIYGSSLSLHKKNGKITEFSGPLLAMLPSYSFNASSFSDQDILAIAKACVGAKTYMWEDEQMEAFIKKEKGDVNATHFPDISRTYLPNDYPRGNSTYLRAAYVLEVYAKDPLVKKELVIDALTGEIIFESNKIKHIDEPGTAHTAYSGTRDITTYRPNSSAPFQLSNLTYGAGVHTHDCFDTDNYFSAAIPTSTTNDWDYPTLIGDAILDSQWGGEQTYAYFDSIHNWASFDNNASAVNSYVHFSLIQFGFSSNSNAFWDGERLTFGDGTPGTNNPFTSLDIYAHEFAHGVTEFSADLEYSDESGALNESFSDIFGACLKYFSKPEDFNWLNGNDIYTNGAGGSRNMSNPNQFDNPDTYGGDFWQTGFSPSVHNNSGVQNYWFYLICDGDQGTNDNGDDFSVSPIGFEAAELIAFRTLSVYLNQFSDYDDARFFSIMSAEDLFGACSPEVIAVTNAWHAVGVGGAYNEAVVASFQLSNNYACSVPATISINNLSINASSYTWDFGDGMTGSDIAPVHIYNNPGTYTVSLIVEGSTLCNTSDTLVWVDALIVEDNQEIIIPDCIPAPASIVSGGGIASFSLESIENESEGSQFPYEDFSCQFQGVLTEGTIFPVELELFNSGYVSIWLDGNNDGDFTADEIAYQSSDELFVHNFDWLVPGVTVFDTNLRLRVIYSNTPVSDPCSLTNSGQAEDYSVEVSDNTLPPICFFTASLTSALPDEIINFTDLSLNVPSNWSWDFPGANVSTSSNQNVSLTYPDLGAYDVTLIVSNQYGNDTLSIPNYINIINTFDMCDINTTNAPNGIFYDPGGENGSYSNNENCSLLIAPFCAETITLSFPYFSTESGFDYVRVYDGADANAPLIGNFSGTQNIAPLTSTGPELFVTFYSDGSVTRPGFEIQWDADILSSEPFSLSASVDNENPPLGAPIQFFDGSSDLANAWNWDFGDGNTSTLQNPIHQYLSSGNKTIFLEASNCDYTEFDTLTIDVQQSAELLLLPEFQDLTLLNCGDSLSSFLVVNNIGIGDLVLNFNSNTENMFDSFEDGTINETIWESVTGVVSDICGTNTGNEALYFNSGFDRHAITQVVTLMASDTLSFYLKYGSSGGSCEAVDLGEYVEVSYRIVGDNTWTSIEIFDDLSNYYSFNQVNIIPDDDDYVGMPVQFRIRQIDNSGTGSDNWAIDDFEIKQSTANVSFSPEAITISGGSTQTINFTIYRDNRTEGFYDNTFHISTNIVGLPVVEYPINLSIEGEGILDHSQDCVLFNTIQEFTIDSQKLVLYNNGCGDIEIEEIVSSHPDFIISYQEGSIVPNDSLIVDLLFSPQSFGDFEETISIGYDNGLEAIVCMEATSLGAPIVSSNPEILDLELINCQDSIQGSFTLYNTGNGPLDFVIQQEVLEDFENGFDENIWTIIGGELGDYPCENNSGDYSCYFYFNGERTLEVQPWNISSQSTISFFLKYGSDGFCDSVEPGEHIVFEYSTDGFNWNSINAYEDIQAYSEFIEITETIPINAVSPNTRFRWTQPFHSGSFTDYWVLDDIRFSGSSNEFSFQPSEGIVAAGDSLNVNFTYYRENKIAGDYEELISIMTNDPTQNDFERMVNVSILGDGELSMNSGCLLFTPILENTSALDSFVITNTGCAPLILTNFNCLDLALVIDQADIDLNPNDSIYVYLEHQPNLFGDYSGVIEFNADGVDVEKCFERTVLEAAELNLVTESVSLVGEDCPGEVQGSFSFSNIGNTAMDWSLLVSNTTDFEEAVFESSIWTSSGVNDSYCGFYNGQKAHKFSNNGTRFISSELVYVTEATTLEFYLKYGSDANDICEEVTFGEEISIQYATNGGSWTTIQAMTDITFYYNWNLVSVDIPDFLFGEQVSFRITQLFHDGFDLDVWSIDDLALNVADVDSDLDFSMESGTAEIDEEVSINFTINTADLNAGSYELEVFLETNDPTQIQTIIPVTLLINGDPDFAYNGPDCHDFGSIFNGTTMVDSIFIENIGCAPLTISSATTSNPIYTVLSYSETISPEEGGSWFLLEFAPETTGNFEETLNINTPQGIETICLVGASLAAPAITVTPEVLNINFNLCSDSVVIDVLVENTGESTLTYETSNIFASDLSLDSILGRWLQNSAAVTQLIPDLYFFSGGDSGQEINDGGNDMYDNGNYLNTNYLNSIAYTGGNINSENGSFGTDGQYFTSKVPGMFLMAADLDDVSYFSITGNLGADGNGIKEETTLTYNSNLDEMYTGYVSRVYDSNDPSINHLIIVPSDDNIEASITQGTQNENHYFNNLENTERIYYILFATNGGNEFVSDEIFQNVFENFVETMLPNLSSVVSIQEESVSLEPNDSSYISLVFHTEDLEPGVFNFTLPINSNDPNSPTLTIPVMANAIDIPCTEFEYNRLTECTGEVQFTDLSPLGADTWYWDFGDGNTSNTQNPTHTYEENGTYTVSLSAGSNFVLSQYLLTFDLTISNIDVAIEASEPMDDGSIVFNGTSEAGETWLWDFGDGNTAESQDASHVYEQSGNYIVTLSTFDADGCSGTASDTIDYTIVGISTLLSHHLNIFPNPTHGVFSLQRNTTDPMKVSLYDANGKMLVAPFSLMEETSNIDIRNQPDGVYFLKVQSREVVYYDKIVKQ